MPSNDETVSATPTPTVAEYPPPITGLDDRPTMADATVITPTVVVAPTVAPAPSPGQLQREAREARKSVGVTDSEVARAAKALARQQIDRASEPLVAAARTHVAPKMHAGTAAMKKAGWKKFGLIAVGVAALLALIAQVVAG